VIGARAWGVSDVIEDGKDGILVGFGDIQALAEAVQCLAGNPDLRRVMGASGRLKALTQHTWDHKYSLIRALYQGLAEESQGRRSRHRYEAESS
jgi:glycosyltransferase involved in cell wall biosynthesis